MTGWGVGMSRYDRALTTVPEDSDEPAKPEPDPDEEREVWGADEE